MKKRIKVLTALLCTAALLAGCGGASGDSGTESAAEDTQKKADSEGTEAESEEVSEVTIGFSSEGDSFDPCTGFGYVGSPMYSNLVKVNGDDQLENDLATDYTG